jgi:hypothetical protein
VEQRDSSTLSLTSALDGVDGQRHAPVALHPGNDPVPTVREVGWAPGPVWTGAENLAPTPPGIRSPDRPARCELLYRLSYPGPQSLYRLSYPVKMNKTSQKTSLLLRPATHSTSEQTHSLCQMAHQLLHSATDGNLARRTPLGICCTEHSYQARLRFTAVLYIRSEY